MSLILWSRYRRQGLRNAWTLSGMNQISAYITAGLFALFSAYVFVAWIDSSIEEAERIGRQYGEQQREELKHDAKAFAHAMNGGTIIDRDTGDVFFFQVSKQKGL